MPKSNYKSIEDNNGILRLYFYNDDVEPENGVPISVLNISNEDWMELLKEANNRLVKLVESDPSRLKDSNEHALNIVRSLLAQQLNK